MEAISKERVVEGTCTQGTCTQCKVVKPATEFSPCKKTKSGLQSWCKKCKRERFRAENRAYMKTYVNPFRADNQALVSNYKAKIGCPCGEKDPVVLDLHHRDPNTKAAQVNYFLFSRKLLLEEIEKCDVLCANCHRRLHARKGAA